MNRAFKSPRERAARALCNIAGHIPDADYGGVALWRTYLPQVDIVLRCALGDEAWQAMVEAEGAGRAR